MYPKLLPPTTSVTAAINTSLGPILGVIRGGVNTFVGIRYAQPPLGPNRFMPPRKPYPTPTETVCGTYAHAAMQLSPTQDELALPPKISVAFGQLLNSREDFFRQNEDCLTLNVWTPTLKRGEKLAVLVMIHGGAFHYGSSSATACDGHTLAKNENIVVVSINHRLNVFGFLNLSELAGEEYAESGNVGMLDLVAGLEWVQENITHFGGDPDNVTICGQSGGGQKVCTLLAMPSARGLFHKAIVQSGPAIRAGVTSRGTQNAEKVLENLGLGPNEIFKLHALPADRIIAAARSYEENGRQKLFYWRPVVDGHVLPIHPFDPESPALANKIPMLIGFNKDEGVTANLGRSWWGTLTKEKLRQFVQVQYGDKSDALVDAYSEIFPAYSCEHLYCAIATSAFYFCDTIKLAERKSKQAAPVYSYQFAWESPVEGGILKAAHLMEAPFTHNLVAMTPLLVGDSPETFELAKTISSAWAEFVRSGNPNVPGLPYWPAYDVRERTTMIFDKDSYTVQNLYSEVYQLLS